MEIESIDDHTYLSEDDKENSGDDGEKNCVHSAMGGGGRTVSKAVESWTV